MAKILGWLLFALSIFLWWVVGSQRALWPVYVLNTRSATIRVSNDKKSIDCEAGKLVEWGEEYRPDEHEPPIHAFLPDGKALKVKSTTIQSPTPFRDAWISYEY